jgi:hypothetical protein
MTVHPTKGLHSSRLHTSQMLLVLYTNLITTKKPYLWTGRPLEFKPNTRRSRVQASTASTASTGNMSISKSARRTQLVLFGDSLTQAGFSVGGWAGHLANHYQVNASCNQHRYPDSDPLRPYLERHVVCESSLRVQQEG